MPLDRQKTLQIMRECTPIIAPSMLKCDFGNMHREVELLEQADAKVLHLDVMDGHFVPNLSYGPMVIERLRDLTETVFDAHLMISEPDRYIKEYLKAGCDCITFHIEAVPEAADLLKQVRDGGAVSGLVVNPGTDVKTIEPYLELCDMVLIMSVEPGFGGQKFMPVCLDKLKWLKANMAEDSLIAIDGGIGMETISQTAEAGANLFVCGSSIFDQSCYKEAMSGLRELATKAG